MKKNLLMSFISAMLTFFIAICAIVIVYAAVSADTADIFGFRLFIIKSGSMLDTLDVNELIITKAAAPGELEAGDIITFISRDPDIYLENNTHRITRIEKNVYHTKGDANDAEDPYTVAHEDVLGKVVFHSRVIGRIISWLSKPANMLLFIILPILAFCGIDIRKNTKRIWAIITEKRNLEHEQSTHSLPPDGDDIQGDFQHTDTDDADGCSRHDDSEADGL